MKKIFVFSTILMLFMSCSDFLDEQVFTEYDPKTFLASESGINAVLTATYSASRPNYRETWFSFAGWNTDHQLERGGGYAAPAATFANFQWEASNSFFRDNWSQLYVAIRNANSLLDNIDQVKGIAGPKVLSLKAEATFLRAFNYYILYDLFGPAPLITSAKDLALNAARATEADMQAFIEKELIFAAENLPVKANLYGKATKGAAWALLGRFYLNTRQWQKSADALAKVIALNEYKLFTPVEGLFSVPNEGNGELIWVSASLPTGPGWNYMPHAYPIAYKTDKVNYGAQFQLRREFVKSFHPKDRRGLEYDPENGKFGWILKKYINKSGKTIDLMNDPIAANESNFPRSFKFTPDPEAQGPEHGNDMPLLRYAEVLISRAEVLNEIKGPNQESIDLLNQIRTRAEAPLYKLADFLTKESLRDQILKERGWEFFTEGLRRQDLIRHGKFISSAHDRGITGASDKHLVFPIPQQEIEANPTLEQNKGY